MGLRCSSEICTTFWILSTTKIIVIIMKKKKKMILMMMIGKGENKKSRFLHEPSLGISTNSRGRPHAQE